MVDPVRIKVFLDSGLQKTFIPLRKPTNYTLPKNIQIPDSLQKALDEIESYDAIIPENSKNLLDEMFKDGTVAKIAEKYGISEDALIQP